MRTERWHRRHDYLKGKRKKRIAKYAKYTSNFYYDEDKDLIREIDWQDAKKFAKTHANRVFRHKNSEEFMHGNQHKKFYSVSCAIA